MKSKMGAHSRHSASCYYCYCSHSVAEKGALGPSGVPVPHPHLSLAWRVPSGHTGHSVGYRKGRGGSQIGTGLLWALYSSSSFSSPAAII